MSMAEILEDDRHSDPDARATMRRELSQAISRRQSITPRVAIAEVCDKVYRMRMQDDDGSQENTTDLQAKANTSQEKRKLVIILVGLPGRGKTYLCNKLMCYLNWCESTTARSARMLSTAVHVNVVLACICCKQHGTP
jgi:signal recognition particle GTPase